MLSLNNITCEKGDRRLFKGLSFTLGDCCCLVIRGDNGSGKTSLLKVIAGLDDPADGEVLYANEKIKGEHFSEYCSMIQYVGHKNAIKPELTVRENIEFWAQLDGSDMAVDAAISFFDLEQYENTQCRKLSAGWKKRVALARLLACKSEIWILDEPFANLDKDMSLRLASVIKTRIGQGGIVIIAAHGDIPVENAYEIYLKDFA